jgi:hypothetical protein
MKPWTTAKQEKSEFALCACVREGISRHMLLHAWRFIVRVSSAYFATSHFYPCGCTRLPR